MAGKTARSLIQFFILLAVGILLIWLSLKQVAPQKDKIADAFANANYFWIAVSMVLALLSHFLRAFRWNYLLEPLGHKVKLFNATCHVIVGYFANYGIPRMGEVSRCTLAARYDKVPFEVGFGTVITERIVDFMLLIFIFVLTLAFQFAELIDLANQYIFDKLRNKFSDLSENPLKAIILLGVVAALIFGIIVLRKKFAGLLKGKLGGILKGMAEGIGSIRKMKQPVMFVLLSLGIWACYFYSLYFCFFALDGTKHLGQSACLTLLLFGTFGVVFSPGGLGAYPFIVGSILQDTFKVDLVSAFALPWLSWTSQFVLIVALGLISLIVLPIYNRQKDGLPRTT